MCPLVLPPPVCSGRAPEARVREEGTVLTSVATRYGGHIQLGRLGSLKGKQAMVQGCVTTGRGCGLQRGDRVLGGGEQSGVDRGRALVAETFEGVTWVSVLRARVVRKPRCSLEHMRDVPLEPLGDRPGGVRGHTEPGSLGQWERRWSA